MGFYRGQDARARVSTSLAEQTIYCNLFLCVGDTFSNGIREDTNPGDCSGGFSHREHECAERMPGLVSPRALSNKRFTATRFCVLAIHSVMRFVKTRIRAAAVEAFAFGSRLCAVASLREIRIPLCSLRLSQLNYSKHKGCIVIKYYR